MTKCFTSRRRKVASLPKGTVSARWLIGICVFLFVFVNRPLPSAALHDMIQGNDVEVLYEPSLRGVAERVLGEYAGAMDDLETALGWRLDGKATLVLVADRGRFEQMGGSSLIAAFALPRDRVIVMHVTASSLQPYAMYDILKHELCHLVLHEHIASSSLPRWLDEGVAQWVSGSLGELLAGRQRSVSRLDISRRFIPLRQLATSFPAREDALLLAYEEARGITEFIGSRYGTDRLLTILRRLAAGNDIEEAVSNTLGAPLDEVEQEWRDSIGGIGALLVWIGQYLYEVLFFLAAVLSIIGFIRLSIARRRRYDEEEENGEDEGE